MIIQSAKNGPTDPIYAYLNASFLLFECLLAILQYYNDKE